MPEKGEKGERGYRGTQGPPGEVRENGRLATIETKIDNTQRWLENDLPVHVQKWIADHVSTCPARSGGSQSVIPFKWIALLVPALGALLYGIAEAYRALAK